MARKYSQTDIEKKGVPPLTWLSNKSVHISYLPEIEKVRRWYENIKAGSVREEGYKRSYNKERPLYADIHPCKCITHLC